MVNVNIIFISSYKMHIMMFIMKHWKIYDDRKGNMEICGRIWRKDGAREWGSVECGCFVFWLFHYIIYPILSLHLIFSFCFIITLLHRGRVFYIWVFFHFSFPYSLSYCEAFNSCCMCVCVCVDVLHLHQMINSSKTC